MNPARDLKKIALDLSMSAHKAQDSNKHVADAISNLLSKIEDLLEDRASIEMAIHQTAGVESELSKDFYDADAHIDEAVRAFKMLKNEVIGI